MTDPRRPLVGVSLPWLAGAYGHDLAPNERRPGWPAKFDAFDAYRPLVEARELGFEAVRVWSCEAGEGIVTRDGVIDGAHPELIANARALEDGARLAGVRVLWTLLDGNTWTREGDALTHAIVCDPVVTARFAERVVVPLVRALDASVTLAIEPLHAPEALALDAASPVAWESIAAFLRAVGDAVRDARPGTLVVAGTRPELVRSLATRDAKLDAVEVYTEGAKVLSGESLGVGALPLIARRDTATGDDLAAHLASAIEQGYAAVFLGRLEGELIDARAKGRPLTDAGARVRALLVSRPLT